MAGSLTGGGTMQTIGTILNPRVMSSLLAQKEQRDQKLENDANKSQLAGIFGGYDPTVGAVLPNLTNEGRSPITAFKGLPATDFNQAVNPTPSGPLTDMRGNPSETMGRLLRVPSVAKEMGVLKLQNMLAPPTWHDTPAGGRSDLVDKLGNVVKTINAPQKIEGLNPDGTMVPGYIDMLEAKAEAAKTPLERDQISARIKEANATADLSRKRGDLISGTGLDDETLKFRAEMWAAGDEEGAYKGIPNSLYGSPARNAISKMGAQISMQRGGGGADQAATNAAFGGNKAGIRTAAQAGAKMDTLSTEVSKFADIAKQASAKVPRGRFVPLTQAEQSIQSGSSDPELAAFVAANTSLVNAYSAVAGRGTPTVSGQEHAYKMLSTATSPEAYNAVVDQILRETEAAKQSPNVTMEDIRKRITAPSGGGSTMPAEANPSATSGGVPPGAPPITTGAPKGSPSATDAQGNKIFFYGGKWQR